MVKRAINTITELCLESKKEPDGYAESHAISRISGIGAKNGVRHAMCNYDLYELQRPAS